MKHSKFLSLMLMAIVAMFAFTACGDDDDNNNGNSNGNGGSGTNTEQQIKPSDVVGYWKSVAFTPEGGKRIEINRYEEAYWRYFKKYNITADGKIEEWSINYNGSEEIRGREEKTLIGKYRLEGSTFIIYDFYEGYKNVKAYEQEGGGTMSTELRKATVSISNSILYIAVAGYGTYELKINNDDEEGGNYNPGSITADQLLGTWYGVDESSDKKICLFVMDIGANGQGHYAEYKAKADDNWEVRDPMYGDMRWTLNNNTLIATIVIPDQGTFIRKGDILSYNSKQIVVRRYLDEEETDEVVMTRVSSADDFMQIFMQMIAERAGK